MVEFFRMVKEERSGSSDADFHPLQMDSYHTNLSRTALGSRSGATDLIRVSSGDAPPDPFENEQTSRDGSPENAGTVTGSSSADDLIRRQECQDFRDSPKDPFACSTGDGSSDDSSEKKKKKAREEEDQNGLVNALLFYHIFSGHP